ncbi:hypothetical protein IVA79_22425 [Bradyrhizobium sp. 138]|uniref:hypothetical protein n=1 Tax=Bradyrhizobium sp. 138 TaxID=2782615 RepID=UPI001FF9D97C|nr:hypothetical protein [Bradyrhizobium sp. 138]MCK1736634.1 hypothetical protein [Bradyrhizobium sp. 138]
MSLWYFLGDWLAGVPTYGALFRRMMINTVWAIGLLFVMMFLGLPGEDAAIVIFSLVVVNGVMSFVFLRQRLQMRD